MWFLVFKGKLRIYNTVTLTILLYYHYCYTLRYALDTVCHLEVPVVSESQHEDSWLKQRIRAKREVFKRNCR